MNIQKISVGNFKSLYSASFEPGKINVFVGANGSGKSTILEAIGLLSAAMTDRVDSASLQRKGVRLSIPSLYKSNFKDLKRKKLTVDLSLEWENDCCSDQFRYDVHLTTPTDTDYWRYHSEVFFQNDERIWGRSNASQQQANSYIGFFLIDDNQELTNGRKIAQHFSSYGIFQPNTMTLRGTIPDPNQTTPIGFFLIDDNQELTNGRKIAQHFSSYGIFQPNTMTLRGTIPDPNQTTPIGLNGGRLAEAIKALIHEEDGELYFGSLYMDDILDMIDWASDISVDAPKKSNINANIPTTRQIIEFTDRYMKENSRFTGYDASEGALYVLFMLALAMHPQGPSIFAVDSFDHALNPRLAKKMIQVFCEQIIQNNKHVFLTTHNPLVLDGLDLTNDDIRLFAVDRDDNGHAQINRILVSQELINEGQSLSRLWINGRLGGVPTLL